MRLFRLKAEKPEGSPGWLAGLKPGGYITQGLDRDVVREENYGKGNEF
jgi:hypothetical protein